MATAPHDNDAYGNGTHGNGISWQWQRQQTVVSDALAGQQAGPVTLCEDTLYEAVADMPDLMRCISSRN